MLMELCHTGRPTASRGQAIITTRNHHLADIPADDGLEVATWDTEKGFHFLVHLLSIDINKQLTEKEAKGAHELSLQLGGHALALSLMAGLISSPAPGQSTSSLKSTSGNRRRSAGCLGTTQSMLTGRCHFNPLSDKTRAILRVMAFLSPDIVPQALFKSKDSNALSDSLKFCEHPFDFSDEMETLMALALVKRKKEQQAFSIHRLVQTSFKHFLGPDDSQKGFNDTTMLISAVFPHKDAKLCQMYHRWNACALYLPHVLSLRDSFRDEKNSEP